MGLKADLLTLPLEEHFTHHSADNVFFNNLENYWVKTSEEIQRMRKGVERALAPLGKEVHTIANYDNFNVSPDLVDEFSDRVKDVTEFYETVTRYTTSTFPRMKLGDGLQKRGVAPHIYESREEARRALAGG
jgi:propionate CoA-transferase